MTFDAHKNLSVSAVATAPSPATSGTSLVVTAGHGSRFPAVPFNATIWPNNALPDPSNSEIVRVTGISTDTLTITRAQESTTARTVVVGDLIAATVTAKALTDVESAITSGAAVLVASSTASASVLAAAAYVCDGTADDVQIQAAVDSFGTPGGVVLLSAGDFNLATGIELKGRVVLEGSGMRATRLKRASGVTGPTIYNHASTDGSTDANAKQLAIRNLRIDGNRSTVTPATTTTTGTNNQGTTTLNVTNASLLLAAPAWVIIDPADANGNREIVRYTARNTGTNQLTLQDATQFGHAAGQTVRQYWAEILFQNRPTWDPKPSADEYEGTGNVVQNVWIEQAANDGLNVIGYSDVFIQNLHTLYCMLRGAALGADTWLDGANIGHSGYEGVLVTNNAHVMNVASYYSGEVGVANAYGFRIEGNLGGHLSNCIAQDNKADGYRLSYCHGFTLAGCLADSNGTSWNGSSPAISPYSGISLDNATDNTITGMTCSARSNGWQPQTHAISFRNGNSSLRNQITLTHLNAGQSILAPINPTAGYGDGSLNNLNINNQAGHQTITYGASITPDPYSGGLVTVGALTGGITIANPTQRHVGTQLTFMLTQDATGGRLVTWGADFDAAGWQPSSVPSSKSSVTYVWDGTKWTLTASDIDIYTAPAFLSPPGLYADTLTTVTAFATNTSYFVYLGRAVRAISSVQIITNVTAAAVTITWAEVGVFRGPSVANGNGSLSRVGFTNVAATFNSTGRKVTTVTVSGVQPGDELWAALGSQATTPFQVRGLLADDIQSGQVQTLAGRISTAAIPVATTLAGATIVPPWVMARL